ncbi:putative cAMP-dependent protein kinase catalytic subunit beta [Blattamonas nauphoetae]|uniref:cAMP-dependent protein kinase catalytic subunit beta n=1 Tax=Blattamonas nauphoetae TaxID=2049346 RepID=A0ABQ9XSH9_9EUKA|nr:putative cAMP-dependent protein kinase catalytic subunit beta [Blattamonas nauphoetae]
MSVKPTSKTKTTPTSRTATKTSSQTPKATVPVSTPTYADGAHFNFSEKPKITDFEMKRVLGTGTFGIVRLAVHKPTNQVFVIKTLNKAKACYFRQAVHVSQERDLLLKARYPRIVRLFETMQDTDNLFLVMEFAPGGEIFTHLRKIGRFDAKTTQFYSAQLVCAIAKLHSLGIAYRDLKPENMLLDARGHLKLTDLGFAKEISGPTFTLCGTPEYLAPELILGIGHDHGVDWWALGIFIFECFYGHPPFYGDLDQMYKSIVKYKVTFPEDVAVPTEAKDLIIRLLRKDKTKRLGCLVGKARDVMRHPFFAGINWIQIEQGQCNAPVRPTVKSPLDASNYPEDSIEMDQEEIPPLHKQNHDEPETDPSFFKDF